MNKAKSPPKPNFESILDALDEHNKELQEVIRGLELENLQLREEIRHLSEKREKILFSDSNDTVFNDISQRVAQLVDLIKFYVPLRHLPLTDPGFQELFTVSKGTYQYEDGSLYEGQLMDGLPHGKGVKFDGEGRRNKGEFIQGLFHGRILRSSPEGELAVMYYEYGSREGYCRQAETGGSISLLEYQNDELTGLSMEYVQSSETVQMGEYEAGVAIEGWRYFKAADLLNYSC